MPRPAVGADERRRHVGLEPSRHRGEAREAARADDRPDLRHHVSDAVRLELLRIGALLLHVRPLAFPVCGVDSGGGARVDRIDAGVVDSGPMARVLEHRERLAAAEEDHVRALELAPRERGVRLARGEEEAVHLVHLRKVGGGRGLAAFEGAEALAEGGLDDVGGAVLEGGERAHPGGSDRPLRLEPLLAQEPPGHRRDERRVERREQGELDVDAGHRGSFR